MLQLCLKPGSSNTCLPISCANNTDVDSTAIPSLRYHKQLVRDAPEKIDEDEEEISIERKKQSQFWRCVNKENLVHVCELVIMSTGEAASGLGFGKLQGHEGRVPSMLPKERVSKLSDFSNVTNH